MLTIVAAALIAFISSIAQALTGFGFALVLVPLLALFFDPKLVVMISMSLGLVSKLPILIQDFRHVEVRRIIPLCVAALTGAAFGVQLLMRIDGNLLRLGIGVIVVVLSMPLLFDRRIPVRREGLASLGVGLISGLLNGSTSMGGPPVVLMGVNQAWKKESFRVNLVAFFIVNNVGSLLMLSASRALSPEVATLDLWLAPGVLLGFFLGNRLFKVIPVERFRKLVILFVILSGLTSIWGGGQALLH